MQLICKHDPHDPDHLICETQHSPTFEWLRRRWQSFYCVGPTCPPHRAYTHLLVDVVLAAVVLVLVVSNIVFLSRARRVSEKLPTLEDKLNSLSRARAPEAPVDKVEVAPTQSAFILEASAIYFSSSGEQLGRGPWPPKAGEITKLAVVLRANIEGNTFRNIEARGELPQYVEWTGFAPLGRGLSYEPETRTVRFAVAEAGSAVFIVAVTPSAQILADEWFPVLKNVRLRGEELASGETREIFIPDVLVETTPRLPAQAGPSY